MKIKIGVICPAEIAFRRFMPALSRCEQFEYVGIASADEEEWFGNVLPGRDLTVLAQEKSKAESFQKQYGGKIFAGYRALIHSDEIDALYVPLPPALHFKWAQTALQAGKHALVEKPSTARLEDTRALIALAKEKNLTLHENYMFIYHRQIGYVQDVITSGQLGDIRLYRLAFGFPFRGKQDFRYNRALGGSALLDCGGYTLKLASLLLGPSVRVTDAALGHREDLTVDLFGSATLRNDEGNTAQVSFGMDNSYKCELEVWGSTGKLVADRIFTAPVDFSPAVTIIRNQESETVKIEPDDQFYHSLQHFFGCVKNPTVRAENMRAIERQSILVDTVDKLSKGGSHI